MSYKINYMDLDGIDIEVTAETFGLGTFVDSFMPREVRAAYRSLASSGNDHKSATYFSNGVPMRVDFEFIGKGLGIESMRIIHLDRTASLGELNRVKSALGLVTPQSSQNPQPYSH